ncbi:MAG: hypothetical protein M5U01_33180 [Ardenticatenaceae bacterium]|nr:hypothetical protein [Ardenticatenaceae bacterium]
MARHELPAPAAGLAADLEVHVGVEIDVAHAAPYGDVGMPFVGIVAQEEGDVGRQAVEGFQARVGVGTGEGQLEGHAATT